MPKVSVIIPVYNAEKYLDKCLKSMLNQTFNDIEIICVDDGSTDNSLKMLEEYKNKDSRIKVINNKNQGPGLSRQCGVNNVNPDSKYLMFCDSDDWYEPDMCEKMYNAIEQQNVDFVMCDTTVHIIENDYNQDRLNGCISNRKIKLIGYQNIDETNVYHISSLLFNKILKLDIIKTYGINFPDAKMHDDSTFIFQYLLLAKTYYGLDEKLYNYAYRKNSLVYNAFNNIDKKLYYPSISCISLLDKFLNQNSNLNLNKKFIASCMFSLFSYDYSHLIKKKHKIKILKMLHNILKNVNYIPQNNPIFLLIKRGKIFEALSQLEKQVCFSPLHNIFSIRNDNIHKVITICGVKLKLKNKKLIKEIQLHDFIDSKFKALESHLEEIKLQNEELRRGLIFNNLLSHKDWIKDKDIIPAKGFANYSLLYILLVILDKIQPENILEFGFGQTTKLTTQYEKFFKKTDSSNTSNGQNIVNKKYDLIIIGSSSGSDKIQTINILDLIPQNLAGDFIIILDDVQSELEQNTAQLIFEKLDENNIKYSKFCCGKEKSQLVITSDKYKFLTLC